MRFPNDRFASWKSVAEIFSQVSIDFNIFTFLVAILDIIPESVQFEPWDTYLDKYNQFFTAIVHIIPVVFSLINYFAFTDQTFKILDLWIPEVIAVIYLFWNFLYTKETGDTVYDFMSWKSDDSNLLIYLIGPPVILGIIHLILCVATQFLKNRFEYQSEWWN